MKSVAKKITSSFFFFIMLMCTNSFSQNLVSNPSFETNSGCPFTDGEIFKATPWISADGSGTPDYMNTCGTGGYAVPVNDPGTQSPLTGNAYAGIFTTVAHGFGFQLREYMQAPLTSPLVAGVTYNVTFNVSLSDVCNYATSGIGAYFTTTAITTPNPTTGGITPQVSNPLGNVITSKIAWSLISGSFVAGGGEQYITIGNFKTNANSNITLVGGGSVNDAYYYIDDVCVTPVGGSGCVAVLPIELLSFTAQCNSSNTVKLQWTTATESNNNYFTIERSNDARDWQIVENIKGAGNSNTDRKYEFVDNAPRLSEENGLYYRLKQVDFDGKYEYSPVTYTDGNCMKDVEFSIFPNPATSNLILKNLPADVLQINIIDITGKIVYTEKLENNEAKTNILNVAMLPQGYYTVLINTSSETTATKFVKIE